MAVGISAIERTTGLLDKADAADAESAGAVRHDRQDRQHRQDRHEVKEERLGGARADFVAMLGRRVAEISAVLRDLAAAPDASRARDDLRRRLHALAAGARLLRFAKLAEEVEGCEARLNRAAERGPVPAGDLAEIRAVLDRVPSLAWGEASVGELSPLPGRVAAPRSSRSRRATALDPVRVPLGPAAEENPSARGPLNVLVVGPPAIADALLASPTEPHEASLGAFEVERTPDCEGSLELARAVAPDVVVVDADRPGALALCEALMADPLTELVPLIALGRWVNGDGAAPFVALGIAKALPKPVSPDTLRRTCAEVIATYVRREVSRAPLGEITIDELGARLAEELRRGLGDAAVASGRGARVSLGEGSEVMAALWGAVARIRDIVTIHSQGEVRFAPSGPEGALPLAPWLGEQERGERPSASQRSASQSALAGVSLRGKIIVVADDDPTVTWFLSGVLQAAGAVVHEAHDGARALTLAFRFTPDLVVSDILMPGLDGFGLCRALRRDLVLRDVPVILLSWKEDLLQRVRELGADADGYLRKEASAAIIVQRVREALHARARVAERISTATEAEVRGRLDGITTRTLLGLACAHRPASIVTVRDAAFLYEVEIRGGRPTRASRTAPDGSFERGASVLAALLGASAGRFVVAAAPAAELPAELDGSLDEQLLPRVALARAAQRLLSGVALIGVERVELSEAKMAAYTRATPEPARGLLCALAAGVSPRALITSGQAPARLLEDVLCDAAAHGAVTAIIGPEGDELLDDAIEHEIEILRGDERPRLPPSVPELDLGLSLATPDPPEAAYTAETAIPGDVEDPSVPPPRVAVTLPVGVAFAPVPPRVAVTLPTGVTLSPAPPRVAVTLPAGVALSPVPPRVAVPLPAGVTLSPAPPRAATATNLASASLAEDSSAAPISSATPISSAETAFTVATAATAASTPSAPTATATPAPVSVELVSAEPVSVEPVSVEPVSVEPVSVAKPASAASAPASRLPVAPVAPSLPLRPARSAPPRPGVANAAASRPEAPAPAAPPPPASRASSASSEALMSLGTLTPPEVVSSPPPSPRVAHAPNAPLATEGNVRLTRRPSTFAPEPTEAPARKVKDLAKGRDSDAYRAKDGEGEGAKAAAKESARETRVLWGLFAVAGVVFAVGARMSRDRHELAQVAAPVVADALAAPPAAKAAPAPAAKVEPAARATGEGESQSDPVLPVETALRDEDKVAAGQGMLEVTAGSSDAVFIDGAPVGSGPVVKRPLAPRKEPYEIRVKLRGEERVRFALVKEGRLTRVRVAPPWSR